MAFLGCVGSFLHLRVEFHSNSGPPMQKNSGLLTQKLLAASNGELYTAM